MLSLNMSQKFVERQFCYNLVLLMGLVFLNSDAKSKSAKYLSYGEPCKIPRSGENLKPHEKCDKAKGMECQTHWHQQAYCLCSLEASNLETITYDRKSKECRLKVGQYCIYVNATTDPQEFQRQSFHDKCHADAECQKETENSEDDSCICKRGYISWNDGSECRVSTSTAVNNNELCCISLLMVFPLIKQFHFIS